MPILLQKSLMVSKNSDSVAVMRFAVEASDDGAAQSGPRQLFYSFHLDEAVPDDHAVRNRAMREYLATLDDAAFGAASEVMPSFVSPSDPAAQWTGAMRGPAFFAYADNYLIDVKFGIIMDVKATRAIRQAEVGAAKTMIERTEERFEIKPAYLAADTAYGSAIRLTGSSMRRRSHRTFRSSTNRSARMGPSRGKTSGSTKNGIFISARPAKC